MPAELPKPEPEPKKPAPEPAAKPKQPASDAREEREDTAIWQSVLEHVKGELQIGIYSILSDSAAVGGVLRGDVLTVQLKNGFAKLMVDKPDVMDKLRSAAAAACGRTLVLRTEEVKASAPTAEQEKKLSDLAKFGVTLE